jgi:hypothetical protein
MIFLRGRRVIAILDVKRTQEMANFAKSILKFKELLATFLFLVGASCCTGNMS